MMESSAPDPRRWWALALLRESRAALARRSYDPVGALTITGALDLLVYAVVKAPQAAGATPGRSSRWPARPCSWRPSR